MSSFENFWNLRKNRVLGCAAKLDGEITLSGCHFGADRIVLSAYWPLKSQITKVFSAHVIESSGSGDPSFLPFLERSRRLMSWHQGAWEDAVMCPAATPLSRSQTFRRGVFRAKDQLLH
jgi:hypothetical protein